MEKLFKFVEEGRIVKSDRGDDYYVIPTDAGRSLEAFLVAQELVERFDGAFGGVEELFVREHAGEGVYGPFVSLPCAIVATLDIDGIEALIKESTVDREIFRFPLKKGRYPTKGAAVCSAVLEIGWEESPSILSKSFSGEAMGELDMVLDRLCKLFPDGLSALSFVGNWYCIGRYAAYHVDVINRFEKMMILVQGSEYTSEVSVCKEHCKLYGLQCGTCAFGAGAGGVLW